MRAYEFLIEYDRSKTIQSLGNKLQNAINQDPFFNGEDSDDAIDTLFDAIENADPTNNKQYTRWIANQYKNGNIVYQDLDQLYDKLEKFNQYKPQLKRLGHTPDINQYTIQTLDRLVQQLEDTSGRSNFETNYENQSDITVLYNGPLGTLAVPHSYHASCELGKGTKWCTAANSGDDDYREYTQVGELFIWRDRSGKKTQIHLNKRHNKSLENFDPEDPPEEVSLFTIMNAQDRPISVAEFNRLRGIPVVKRILDSIEQHFNYALKLIFDDVYDNYEQMDEDDPDPDVVQEEMLGWFIDSFSRGMAYFKPGGDARIANALKNNRLLRNTYAQTLPSPEFEKHLPELTKNPATAINTAVTRREIIDPTFEFSDPDKVFIEPYWNNKKEGHGILHYAFEYYELLNPKQRWAAFETAILDYIKNNLNTKIGEMFVDKAEEYQKLCGFDNWPELEELKNS